MWEYNHNELYHYGIKGQKWGVRRFQNEDGTLTPAGKERYDDDNGVITKKKRVDRLIAKYQNEGMTRSNAEQMAKRRINSERFVAAAAITTVAALAAYKLSKDKKYKIDTLIKQGDELQRITASVKTNKPLYVSFDKNDNIKYKGLYGVEKGKADLNKVIFKAGENIKIASKKNAEDTFVNLYKSDPEFKKAVLGNFDYMRKESWFDVKSSLAVKEFLGKADNQLNDKDIRNVYDAFNIGLVNDRGVGKEVSSKFYSKLSKLGYDAITDVNDKKYSGYKAKSPTIVFNTSKLLIDKVEALSKDEILDNFDKARNIIKKQNDRADLIKDLKDSSKVLGVAGASAAASLAIQNASIMNYRKKHPKTELSDKEILELLYNSKGGENSKWE